MKAPWVILLFAVAMALAFLGGRCSAPRTSFSEAPLPDPRLSPPDTVRITRIRIVPVQDSTWRHRYDSLLAAQGANVDTTAQYLARPWVETHRWRIDRPDIGFLAAGDLHLAADPIEKRIHPTQLVDTLQGPKPKIITEYRETISVPWLVAAIAAGFGIGAWVGSR